MEFKTLGEEAHREAITQSILNNGFLVCSRTSILNDKTDMFSKEK